MLKDCFRERVLSRGLAAGLVTADSSGSYYFGHPHPALRQKRVRGAHQRHSDLLQGETWHDMTWHDLTWHDMTWHISSVEAGLLPRPGLRGVRGEGRGGGGPGLHSAPGDGHMTHDITLHITFTITYYITGGGHGELLHLPLHLLLPGQVSTSTPASGRWLGTFQLKGARTKATPLTRLERYSNNDGEK